MEIKASNGCFLTEVKDLPISLRRFETVVDVATIEEAAEWREVTESEKDKMILHGELLEVPPIDEAYLEKVNVMLQGIANEINNAHLTTEVKIANTHLFPKWEDLVGQTKYEGFCFQYDGKLYSVATNHTFSIDIVPVVDGVVNEAFKEVVAEEINENV